MYDSFASRPFIAWICLFSSSQRFAHAGLFGRLVHQAFDVDLAPRREARAASSAAVRSPRTSFSVQVASVSISSRLPVIDAGRVAGGEDGDRHRLARLDVVVVAQVADGADDLLELGEDELRRLG